MAFAYNDFIYDRIPIFDNINGVKTPSLERFPQRGDTCGEFDSGKSVLGALLPRATVRNRRRAGLGLTAYSTAQLVRRLTSGAPEAS